MHDHDTTQNGPAHAEASHTERRVRRFVVPDPDGYAKHERIDWIHNPELPTRTDSTHLGGEN